jgi:hypothetical protein
MSSNDNEAQQKSHNIQPQTLIQAMIESEPCLFGNANPVDVKTVHVDSRELLMIGEVLEAAKFHARYQVEFWQELSK